MTDRKLHISKTLSLPQEAVTETFAILGKRGTGKTNTGVVLVEELVATELPVVVVDPVGVWWGLRLDRDGKSPGLPVIIFGGPHGDIPLTPDAGEEVASIILEAGRPCLLDLSGMRKGQQVHFMVGFCEKLYTAKAEHREPLHLVIDECDAFAPQRTGPDTGGEAPRLLGAMEDLIRRGRSRGIGMTMITQRPAVLNKNVLTQAEVLVVFRLTAPQDRSAIDDWTRANAEPDQMKELERELPGLPKGNAFVWSPGWLEVFKRVHIRERHTFDSSATPKPGERAKAPKALSPVDLEAFKERIAATLERVKADDPKALRARIAQLERELREVKVSKATPPAPLPKPEIVEVTVFTGSDRAALMELSKTMRDTLPRIEGAIAKAKLFVAPKQGDVIAMRAPAPKVVTPPAAAARRASAPLPVAVGGDHQLGKCERTILSVLVQRHPTPATASQLGILGGYSVKSGGFRNALSVLRTQGLIEGGKEAVRLTAAGVATAPDAEPLPSPGPELLAWWGKKVGKCERMILEVLYKAHPGRLSKDDVGERTGYQVTSGGFRNALSVLRTLELIEGSRELHINGNLVA